MSDIGPTAGGLSRGEPPRNKTAGVEALGDKGRSVRVRLLAIALLPTLVVLPIFLVIAALNWSQRFDNLLITKINGDLTIAHQYLSRILESSGQELQAFGQSARFAETSNSGNDAALLSLLDDERAAQGLDFLYLVDNTGKVLASPRFSDARGLTDWPVVEDALSGQARQQIDLFRPDQLHALSPDLAERARVALVPTKAAAPTERTEEGRGMIVHSAAPVSIGARPGALVSGVLLNRNLDFIDTINELVYPKASLPEGSQGTATLFLDDVRVSTNVRLFQNQRALGTRVSQVVRDAVLGQGNVWLDRAFVVNDWYVSAYEPITDSFGQRIGMLYVGFLDAPFSMAKKRAFLTLAGGLAAVVLVTIPIFLRWARQIFNPLENVLRTITRVEMGDLGARTGTGPLPDEIGRVAHQMDLLLDQIEEHDRDLHRRIEERTRELRIANQQLEATTKQLIVSEKLAAVGEIAAGIAHEINNPIAVIQGNLDVIRNELGKLDLEVSDEFRLIDEQIHSIFVIVNKLLQFTRPDEYADTNEAYHVAEVIRSSVPLVQHLLNKVSIRLDLHIETNTVITINRTEIQQVLINLFVNAIHAMPDGGTLRVAAVDESQEGHSGVKISVSDNGKGMNAQTLARIFDPFFTTKQGEGSGLGLSISRKIIRRYGGTINASSTPGKGACFVIWLPADKA